MGGEHMAYIAQAVAKKFGVFGNDIEAKENGEGENKNILNSGLPTRFNGWCHTLMVT